jgi:hypothetical protein
MLKGHKPKVSREIVRLMLQLAWHAAHPTLTPLNRLSADDLILTTKDGKRGLIVLDSVRGVVFNFSVRWCPSGIVLPDVDKDRPSRDKYAWVREFINYHHLYERAVHMIENDLVKQEDYLC